MELFNVLQPNMFSLLTSKNRNIYVSSLFILRKAFLQEFNIEKDKLVRQLTQNIEKQLLELDYESENITEKLLSREPKSLANFIIKRFEETGWIECEYNRSSAFKENIMLPPHAVKLVDTLYEIANESDSPYTIHLYNVYSSLYSATTSKEDYLYISLTSSIDELGKLENSLKLLNYDLRKRYRIISSITNSNEILAEHFDDYHERIVRQIIIPLKSKDSVSRFKGSIIEILVMWLRNRTLMEKTANQAFYSGQFATPEEAFHACRNKINYIVEKLDEAERILDEIDTKNNAYVSSVTQKLKYIINSNKSTKKRLSSILARFRNLDSDQEKNLLTQISAVLNLSDEGYLDAGSLFIRGSNQKAEYSEPAEIDIVSDFSDDGDLVDDALNSPYTSRNVLNYIERLMDGRDELKLSEWQLVDSKELIIAVNSTIKGFDSNVFYKVEVDNGIRLDNQDFNVPETTFIRRRKL